MDDLEDDMLLDWSRQFRNLLHLHQSISAIATATACWFGLKAVTFFSVKPWNLLMFELLIWQESGLWCVHGVLASYCHNGWQWGKPSNYHALVSYILLNWTNHWIASKLKYQSCKGIALALSKPHAEIGIRFSDSWSPNTWNKKISLMGLFCTEKTWVIKIHFFLILATAQVPKRILLKMSSACCVYKASIE